MFLENIGAHVVIRSSLPLNDIIHAKQEGKRCRSWLWERFVVHAGERNSSSAPKSPRKPIYFKFIFPGAPQCCLLFARVPVPVPFIKTAPGRAGRVFGKFYNTALALCLEGGSSA